MDSQDRDRARHPDGEPLPDDELQPLTGATPRDVRPLAMLVAVLAVVVAGLCVYAPNLLRAQLSRRAPAALFHLPAPAAPLDTATVGPLVKTWPGGLVLFANEAPDQGWAVEQAIQAWNASGASVHFQEVPRAQAELVIDHQGSTSCSHAEATVGAVPQAHVQIFMRNDSDVRCSAYSAAVALTHELGHVLGLGHTTGECSVMNPMGGYRGPQECDQLEPWEWDCRLLEPGDVARAIGMYGGSSRLGETRGCPMYDAIAAPGALRLGSTSDGSVAVSFARPPEPVLPQFLATGASDPSFSTSVSSGSCLGTPSGSRYRWDGDLETLDLGARSPGSYCVEVWAYDGLGRPSAGPATLLVDVPS
jgi:hypothetical protein